jgi:hypothetical protein
MPAEIEQPLAVVFTLPGGEVYRRALHDLPNQALAADLAVGLVAATHPHGPIRTRSVASQYVQTGRRMVRELAGSGFTAGIAGLTSAAVVQYWLTCDFHRERRIRVILRSYATAGGDLDPGVLRHLEGRRINAVKPSRPNRPYSESEWQRLSAACTEMISAARLADRDAAAAGGSADRSVADRAGVGTVRRYPDVGTALAYLTLFAMLTGIVPDGIDRLTMSDITRTAPTSILLSYNKGRTGRETLNLPRGAVRLLDRWLDCSAGLRARAADLADQLWIFSAADGRVLAGPRTQSRRRRWVETAGLLADDGRPLALHGGRIRATYHHRRDRSAWTGRTTIDPNHSAQVEGDHYLHSHTPAQLDALEAIIEQAQTDLRRKAEPPVVLTGAQTAEFAAGFPRLVEQAGLDAAAVDALLTGEQDVFVAACAAPLNSPHAPAGTLCPARPWVCLLCPLAAFVPRHLPNLLRLKEFFAQQATQMSAGQFLRVFGPYAARLDEDILPRFSAAALAAADGILTELPLHLEELPL